MAGQKDQLNKRRHHKGNDILVVVNWQQTQEISPAFRKLMAFLMEPRHHKEGSEATDK